MTISRCLGTALMRLSKLPAEDRDAVIERLPEQCPGSDCTTGTGCRAYVASVAGSAVERRRRECEARHYLRCGYTTDSKVNQLTETVALRRGRQAADQLRADMRAQWRTRATWLTRSAR